ncbi:MAG: hypothetical protein U0165_02280 [Polyangiaceae bacterium]
MNRRCLSLAIALTVGAPAGVVALVAGASVAEASLFREATLEHLASRSTMVIEGTTVEARSQWEDIPNVGRRIVTYTRVTPSRSIVGSSSGDVWVRTLGGRIDKIGQIVEGEAKLGLHRKVLLFLRPAVSAAGTMSVTEMGQGHYLLDADDKGVARLKASIPTHLLTRAETGTGARVVLEGKTIEEAAASIVAARSVKP